MRMQGQRQVIWRRRGDTIRATELLSASNRLDAEIRAIIDRATPVDVQRPTHHTLFAAGFLRSQASQLLTWLAATHEALPKADRRRQMAAMCISDIEEGYQAPRRNIGRGRHSVKRGGDGIGDAAAPRMDADRDSGDLTSQSGWLIDACRELGKGARAHLETAARSLAKAEQHLDRTRNLLQCVWLRRAV
jgi:hypothetical protein